MMMNDVLQNSVTLHMTFPNEVVCMFHNVIVMDDDDGDDDNGCHDSSVCVVSF